MPFLEVSLNPSEAVFSSIKEHLACRVVVRIKGENELRLTQDVLNK